MGRRFRRSALRCAALAAAGLLAAAGAAAEPLRVMAFGDSLTKGTGSTHGAGYRLSFLRRMKEAGVEVDMVGSFHHGPKDIDRDHQGHQGQGVAKLDSVSWDELRRERPDAVLLMIGTNDAKESTFVADAFRIRYSVLLDRILSESRTRLVVATVPPAHFGKRSAVREALNAVIQSEVDKRVAQGKAVRLVDVYHLVDVRADFLDSLHVNDQGYDKIGNAFAAALLELLQAPAPAAAAAAP
jgi:lysophospholipase L1-like esterase